MKASRRAVALDSRFGSAAALRAVIVALASALFAVCAALAVVTLRVARRVVQPAARAADTRILDVDVSAQTITLSRTPDTELPGRYGLFTTGAADYLKIGS